MAAAMILCAGLGTRLRPLTAWRAKPMVPVGDVPAVEHIAAALAGTGAAVERVVVNVHHRVGDVRPWAERRGIAVSEERELLGTAGGVARAAPLLGSGDVLVWNGDILLGLGLGLGPASALAADLLRTHRANGAVATLAVAPRTHAGEGNVGLAEDGRVVRLRTHAFGAETRGADFIGIHVAGAELRGRLPALGCLVADVWIPALARGATLASHLVTDTYVDVGSLTAYAAANAAWLAGRESWVAPDAVVEGRVERSIVGSGAQVLADVTGVIVWPGAVVRAPVHDAVVAPEGVAALT